MKTVYLAGFAVLAALALPGSSGCKAEEPDADVIIIDDDVGPGGEDVDGPADEDATRPRPRDTGGDEHEDDVRMPIEDVPSPPDAEFVFEPVPFDPDLWRQPNPCHDTVSYPPTEAFYVPDNTTTRPLMLTRSDFLSNFGSVPGRGMSWTASTAYHVPFGTLGTVFARRGEDVKLHVLVLNPDPDDYVASLSVLVDYRAVDARIVRWNPERTRIISESNGTAVRFDVEHDVEVLDITIPASQFPEDRAYDLAIGLKHLKDLPGRSATFVRVTVYYEGFQRPSHPCFEPPLEIRNVTELETDLAWVATPHLLFAEGIDTFDLLTNPIRAERGQRFELYFSLQTTFPRRRPAIAVPLMNGQPIGDPWYLSLGQAPAAEPRAADARKTFEVTMPDEPGVYDVYVGAWDDAYIPLYDLNGVRNAGVSVGGGSFASTNIMRFIVE